MDEPILAGIDIETTGFLAHDHRIIEIYIGLYRGRSKFWEYEQRFDPERSIPADAQRVHGISSADLFGKPKWHEKAPLVRAVLSKADGYVWQNGDEFDGPFINQELKRVGLQPLPERPTIDTMLSGVWATHDGKKPRLEELCFSLGIPYDHALAHGAAYDVDRTMDCYWKGLDFGFFQPITISSQKAA